MHSVRKYLKIGRGMRRAKSSGEAKEDCERAAHLVRTRKTYDADGNLVMTIYAKADVAPAESRHSRRLAGTR